MAFDPPPLPPSLPPAYPEFVQWWGTRFVPWWQQLIEALVAQETVQDEILEALLSANASISEVSPITITADYTGAVNPASQIPRNVVLQRFNGSDDVTNSTDWTIDTITGGINASVGLNTGLVQITDVDTSGSVLVASDYLGVVKTRLIPITRTQGAPPTAGSGGGASSSTSTFSSINSASHSAITGELTVPVGASGNVDLSFAADVTTTQAPPNGSYPVWGIWRWWDGAVWQNVGSEVISNPVCSVFAYGGYSDMSDGALSVNVTKTGLTPSTNQKFQFYARNNSGARTMDFIGSAAAVPQ